MFFLKYKKKNNKGRVRLCGIMKKNIWCLFNLHKLTQKKGKTGCSQSVYAAQKDTFRKQFLFPVIQVLFYDVTVTVFIDRGIIIHNRILW